MKVKVASAYDSLDSFEMSLQNIVYGPKLMN